MQLHQLQRQHKNSTKKRVGRGGTRGKTSGRGHKGQKARAGHRIRPAARDIIKKLPKKRGYRFSSIKEKAVPINLSLLEKNFEAGDRVTPRVLKIKGLMQRQKGKKSTVKILGNGMLTKKLLVSGCLVSKSALEQIQKTGGVVE